MKYQASTQTNVKHTNQSIIFHLLLEAGPMTRADLAKKMHSSKPTVSKNVEELIKAGKIVEIGKDDNMVGKKGMLLDINTSVGYVLALDLSRDRLKAVVVDLKGRWIETAAMTMEAMMTDKYASKAAVRFLETLIKMAGVDHHQILYASMAYSGVVGKDDGFYMTNNQFKETLLGQIKPYIIEVLNVPFTVRNDLNLAAIAEKKLGPYERHENLYLLSADIGVGAGIIIGHQLYEGDRNAAGEVGFILPRKDHKGQYLTLEDRISIPSLVARYSVAMGVAMSFENLKDAVVAGEGLAMALYQDILDELALTITNMASVLDIATVVVEGRLFTLKDTMVDELSAIVSNMTPFNTNIYRSKVDDKSLYGAVLMGLESAVAAVTAN